MPQPLRVLIVEDNPHDAELVVRGLRRAGFEPAWQRVETEAEFSAALRPDTEIVISDYAMPEFSGLRALELLRQRGLDVPFILVSATIGEETAVAAMKQGAADYLLKDRMKRLGAAVTQALEQSRLRREGLRADAALREAHAQLNHLVARSPTVIYQLKLTGTEARPHFVSENIFTLTGYAPEETLHPEWWAEHVHPDDRAGAEFSRATARATGTSRTEYRIRHKDGSYLWLEDRKRVLPNLGSGPVEIVGGWTDITARKQAEEIARETEARFRQVVENIHEVFWLVDAQTQQALYVSPSYETVWGRPCDTLYAGTFKWLETVHPEDRERMREAASTKQLAGTYDETYRIVRPDGLVRWVRDRAYPIKGADGTVRRIVGVAEDVTAARDLESKFLRAQRLEAIGTLSSGIAHDLNNILAPMLMAAGLLRSDSRDARSTELIGMIETGAQRGAAIIRQLLTFSRGIEGERVSMQLRHLIREMAALARETFPRDIVVSEDIARDLRPVLGDATQLHQVLMNLCVNARDAMPGGGRLTLRAVNATLRADALPAHLDARAGEFVLLTVTDTGHGIPAPIVDRIFDPFFTTKTIGKGTGLGLSTALGIVKSHGGFIFVKSGPGQGTEFAVYLPVEKSGAVPPPQETIVRPRRGQGELVLIVDDEDPIRRAACESLQQWGYRVLAANHGEAGLAIFRERRADVKLAIVDLMMPVMGGAALVKALREFAPELRIIAMTGMEPGEKRAELRALEVNQILLKPFLAQQLQEAVGAALTDRPAGKR